MGASVSNPNFDEPAKDSGTGATVLIADDDPAIRLVVRHRLEADGLHVEEASDSHAALEALRTGRFDVALVDIIMPGMGGLEVLSTAKAESIRTLIIVITAASTMNNAVEAMKRGAHDYLTKPFANLDLVAAAVRRAVEVSRRRPALELASRRSVAPSWPAARSSGAAPRCRKSTSWSGGWSPTTPRC